MGTKSAYMRARRKSQGVFFKTTLFELCAGLIDEAKTDTAIVARARRIFADYNARWLKTLTPLRLAAVSGSAATRSKNSAAKFRSNRA